MNDNKKINHLFSIENWRRKKYCYLFIFLEFLSTKFNFLYQLMMMSRRPPVTNEIKRAGISSTDKILVIGCGILPSTIIILAEETQAYLTGIDINSKITNLAKSYINKKRFSNRIDILVGDGVNYPVNEFDVIFIAINVWPINQILQHLAQNMKSGSKFIYREFESDSSLVSSEEKIFTSFTLDSSFNYPMTMFSKYPMTKSFLFIKN